MKTACAILLFSLLWSSAIAQVFPVHVEIHIAPPHTPYLSDYTVPGAQKLVVRIRMNDLTVPEYHCRIRFTIEGTGIVIRSREMPPVVLAGGLTETLFGSDLHDYFLPDALEFEGLSRSDYNRTTRLPDGVYSFSVEVLDQHRGTVVSNRATTTAWIFLSDPPLLNMPHDQANIPLEDPMNVMFTWTPRHGISLNTGFQTMYTFRLIELWPEDRNPNEAFLSQQLLYEATTDAHHLNYGAAQPHLLPGRKYAWQVQASNQEGNELFKNQGRSEVFVFRYGQALPIPNNLRMRWAKPTTLAINWDPVAPEGEVRYRLQYRPRRRVEGHIWYETWTRFTEKTLYDLQANTEYEMRIRSENAVQQSEYSESRVFKTLHEPRDQFSCRDDPVRPPAPDDSTPLFPLAVNDTIRAGGYDVLVRDVLRDGSRYYGSGLAIVPWLNHAKVRVTFEKITVNAQFRLTAGAIRSVWEAGGGYLLEHQTPLAPGSVPQTGAIDITIVSVDTLVSINDAAIAAVTTDQNGNAIITTTEGHQQIIPLGKSVAIVDEVGNGYIVDAEGNIAKTTAAEAVAVANRGARRYEDAVEFTSEGSRLGFDRKQYDALARYYQRLGNGSFVPWKALSSSEPDKITAVVQSENITPTHVTFEAGGVGHPVVANGKSISASIRGTTPDFEEELLALHSPHDSIPPTVVGKVNIITYNPAHYKLVIVPVNTARLPEGVGGTEIERYLDGVYSQAVVGWDVTVMSPLAVALDETFDNHPPGGLSSYTADMKKVLDAFGSLDDNTWYLFIVEKPSDDSALGYMPRNRQAGFVFTSPHGGRADRFLKTIAHELGHGAFNLSHTFHEHPLPPGGTNNLMDYSEGTELYKYQWDYIHQPRGVWGLFEGGESFYESGADAALAWWNQQPPFRKAAKILAEHLTATGAYQNVKSACGDDNCIITADLALLTEIRYTLEVTLPASMSADDLILMLISEYRVDLWEAFNVRAENLWDELYHWWRKQNDDLAQRKGWQVSALNFVADVVTTPTLVPAVQGWITGRHWRDGHTLSGWEQALAILDFMVAEELTKACITNIVVRFGGKTISLMRISQGARRLAQKALEKGLSFTVVGNNEIHILTQQGKIVGKIVNETLIIPYPGFSGDVVCTAGKTTTVLGKYIDRVDGEGLSFIKANKLYHYGEDVGGINMLNAPVYSWPLNEQWLREALDRGDVIRVVSDPRANVNLWVDGIVGGKRSPFGQEVDLLEELGYRFDAVKFEYVK